MCGFQIPNFTLESYEPLVHDGSSYVRLSEKSDEQVTLNVRSKLIWPPFLIVAMSAMLPFTTSNEKAFSLFPDVAEESTSYFSLGFVQK